MNDTSFLHVVPVFFCPQRTGWINSIGAGYTVEELRTFIEEAGCKDWTVHPVHLIDLEIFRKAG